MGNKTSDWGWNRELKTKNFTSVWIEKCWKIEHQPKKGKKKLNDKRKIEAFVYHSFRAEKKLSRRSVAKLNRMDFHIFRIVRGKIYRQAKYKISPKNGLSLVHSSTLFLFFGAIE